eukprot:CAMPEP_0183366086 /NCGR_PEP_ID=MMETSP0164_2-20130417/87331_1 /TAXON_ID=221442 /ORGANISM="Coccolithus pelagicus ssp braarudi, Strain PLY182g" /LENGTH=39 /DNA_ID= /DNA_START= /DNA_END= /DNA_ORIENTATION=
MAVLVEHVIARWHIARREASGEACKDRCRHGAQGGGESR